MTKVRGETLVLAPLPRLFLKTIARFHSPTFYFGNRGESSFLEALTIKSILRGGHKIDHCGHYVQSASPMLNKGKLPKSHKVKGLSAFWSNAGDINAILAIMGRLGFCDSQKSDCDAELSKMLAPG